MKYFKRIIGLVLVAAMTLSLSACSLFKKSTRSFEEFCDSYFQSYISDPFTAHFTVTDASKYGVQFDKDDYTLGEIDVDDFDAQYEELEKLYDELCSYNYDKLSEEEKLTYECLKTDLENQIAYKGTDLIANVFSPSSGIFANLSTNFVEYVFYKKSDIEDYLTFLADIKRFTNEAFAFLRLQSEKGYFMADAVVDESIEVCEDYLNAEVDPYIATFEMKINAMSELSDSEKKEYIERNEKLVKEEVRPAYEKAVKVLTELKGTAKNQAGLAGFGKDGKKLFEAILKDKTSMDITPKKAAEYLDEKLTEMLTEYRLIYQTNPQAFEKFEAYEPEERTPEEALKYIISKFEKDFPKPVTTSFNIEYQLPACEIEGTLAYYMTARIDDISVNNMKVNGSAVSEDSLLLYTTIAHEGFPGHMYQFTTAYDSKTHNVRKILDFIGATEGWAQYAADIALDYLGVDADVARLIYIDNIIGYIVPSRVDIGVNYEGWGKQETGEYLADLYNVGSDYENDSTVDYFFNYVVGEPGLLLPYTFGELKMMDLRDQAEGELGKKFDAVEFHKVILDCGIAPFAVYEKAVSEWIESK